MGCHFLLQGIFPTQGPNPHLLPAWAGGFPAISTHWEAWEYGYPDLRNGGGGRISSWNFIFQQILTGFCSLTGTVLGTADAKMSKSIPALRTVRKWTYFSRSCSALFLGDQAREEFPAAICLLQRRAGVSGSPSCISGNDVQSWSVLKPGYRERLPSLGLGISL